jgi:hypothetical protein
MAAVQPEFGAARQKLGQRAASQPLQAGRPLGPAQRGPQRGIPHGQPVLVAQHGDGHRRVQRLMRAGQTGQRQVERAVPVAIVDLPGVDGRVPGPAARKPLRAGRAGDLADAGRDLRRIKLRDERHLRFGDAGLFRRDRFDPRAEKGLVVEPELGDPADQRPFEHIGGVEPAAEPDLDHAGVGRVPAEGEKGRCRGDLEKGRADPVRRVQHLGQQSRQRLVLDQLAGQPMRSLKRTRCGLV